MVLFQLQSFAQDNYWQQAVHYTIDVELNDKEKSITAKEQIVYINHSPDTLNFIWFHIWPNAYKNETTALFNQINNDEQRKKKKDKVSYGYIDGLAFTVNGQSATLEPHPNNQYIDVVKLILPKALLPNDSVTIATPFKVYLPNYFSRSGHADGEFMLCQWYPKPAVYDKNGWHEFPYLDMGEFYSEFGSFKVNITLPSDYIVAATGTLLNKDELAEYKRLGSYNIAQKEKKPLEYKPLIKGNKTLSYYQNNIPDFAWFADKDFVIQYDTVQLNSGTVIDAFTYYHNKKNTLWNYSIDYVKDATRKYSEWIGDYAYPVVQAVEGPKNNSSGGMEYPTITLITSPDAKKETLDAVIAHEVGHNWFMCMLGNNERKHTWQDEGMNTYFQFRYEAEKYRSNSIFGDAIPASVKEKPVDEFLGILYNAMLGIPMESAIDIPANEFKNSDEYGLISYVKAAVWMYIIEASTSKETVDKAFKLYFNKWKFKHPQPSDMQAAFEEAAGKKMDAIFGLLKKKGSFKE